MTRILGHKTLIETLTDLSEGNPDALSVLVRLHKEGDDLDPDSIAGGWGAIFVLDQCGIYGPAIWILYKDYCHQDLTLFMGVLRAVQLGFEAPNHVYMATQGAYLLHPAALLAKVQDRLPHFGGVLNPPTKDDANVESSSP